MAILTMLLDMYMRVFVISAKSATVQFSPLVKVTINPLRISGWRKSLCKRKLKDYSNCTRIILFGGCLYRLFWTVSARFTRLILWMQGRRSQEGDVLPLNDNIEGVLRTRNQPKVDETDIKSEEEETIEPMEDNNDTRCLEEFARPTIPTSPSCILLPTAARNYELKSLHFNMLPSFYGLPNENPLTFMKEFYATVSTFPLQGVTEEQLKMRCFPYTLKDQAKFWLMSLTPGSFTSWDAIYNKFVGKFYSHQKTGAFRRQISTFTQVDGEPFHEAWERYKLLLLQCPHHGYTLELQMQFFYDGLTQTCQSIADNAAGGAMFKKAPQEAYDIYEMLGSNSQQRDARSKKSGVYELNHSDNMARQIGELNKKIDAMLGTHANSMTQVEVCALCNIVGHSTHACWKNHPNLSWSNTQNQLNPYVQPKTSSLEESIKLFVQESRARMDRHDAMIATQETKLNQTLASMGKLEVQVGQLVDVIKIKEPGKLPSQPEQAKAITVLRSGKVIDNQINYEVTDNSTLNADQRRESVQPQHITTSNHSEKIQKPESIQSSEKQPNSESSSLQKSPNPYIPPIPFPGRLKQSKLDKSFSEIYDTLSKVNINLPLLDVIRNMPAYAKFFKELNTYKRKYGPHEKVMVSENVSAVLQRKLPPKLKDPGSFSINITVGDKKMEKAMLDLGASINLMPYSVYLQLGLGEVKPTTMSLQLAD
ncbi:uncharacterized protein LOC119995545 [Tripterygium wilfordii]|uniref:uncharacterized protein LOC119995545 n=1 Tax=Tripterygium wilfordii TaxID=458696 RepID=UPI0018F8211D|nr:uncharacterized protein LOC119995545 [Tripterygium wilfordii]